MDNVYEDYRRVCKVTFMPLADQTLWHASKDKNKGKAEYVWIADSTIKSKTVMVSGCLDEISELPLEEHLSKFSIRPVAIFDDITESETDVLVLCEEDDLYHTRQPHQHEKKREAYRKIVLSEHVAKADLRFEIDQEFAFKQCVDMSSFSVGRARKVCEALCKACFNALIPIHSVTYKGSHEECWSYTIGPCTARQAADMLWMSRYILKRVSEDLDLTVTFEPLNTLASGDHPAEQLRPSAKYRFSSEKMRDTEKSIALPHVDAAYDKLVKHKVPNIEAIYGRGCDRSTSRVPLPYPEEKREQVEDSRPAGYSDPYDVIGYIVKTCFL